MLYRLRRRFRKGVNEVFYRVGYKEVRTALERLGVSPGDVVCVHSALNNIGYLTDGPGAVVRALQAAVGKDGAVLMPTFPFSGTMVDWLESGTIFDVRETPSRVGFLTEYFREQEGVRRSEHPTHAVAGWGERAWEYLDGHEHSQTPFGMETPYGRLAESSDAYMLLLETRLLSLPHHLQERVDYPNLYLPDLREVPYIDSQGAQRKMHTRVMRPKVPYLLAIPASHGDEPQWCTVHDFCLLFPHWRLKEVGDSGVRVEACPEMASRRANLEAAGTLCSTRLGRGEVGLLKTSRFIAEVQPSLEAMLARYRAEYTIENVKARNRL